MAHTRLHLYKGIEKLNEHMLYMDTDSVVFTQQPGQWKPQLGNFFGEWTNEVVSSFNIIDFTTCGPKNYGYVTKDARGMLKTSRKVKGLCLTDLVLKDLPREKRGRLLEVLQSEHVWLSNRKRQRNITMKH